LTLASRHAPATVNFKLARKMKTSKAVLYREYQPMKRWILRLLALAIGSASLLVVVLVLLWPHLPTWLVVVMIAAVLALIAATFTFRRLSIEVTETGISFGFGFVRTRLRWKEIESIKPEPYLFSRFIGWGVRYDLRNTFAYVAQSGMGVELQTRKRWRYFFTTERPQKLVELSQVRINQATSGLASHST